MRQPLTPPHSLNIRNATLTKTAEVTLKRPNPLRVLRSQRSEDSDSAAAAAANDASPAAPPAARISNVRHKVVVMGAARVGKSSLISQFLYGTFSPKYKRTVEEMHHGEFNVAGVHLTLDILDTSGAYEFPAMRALSISSADAFILVYDVTDAATFEEARALRDQIHETKGGTAVPIVVVGNKVDLAGEREVSEAVGTARTAGRRSRRPPPPILNLTSHWGRAELT